MDLLRVLDAAGAVAGAVGGVQRSLSNPPWTRDAHAFHTHFGVPYETYCETVTLLDPSQQELLQRTIDVNPEAAVLWVLAMEEVT